VASRQLQKDFTNLQAQMTTIEEVYLKDNKSDALGKLEDLAKAGSTVDAATLMSTLKDMRHELKIIVSDSGKTIKHNVATINEKHTLSLKADLEQMRE